nr:MAG TPA: hypothetical protein [Caudoviricetes sp.]
MVPISHSSVNLPFTLLTPRLLSTHVGCLLTTCFLGVKTPLCVTTILVRVVTLSALCSKVLRQCVSHDCNV